MVPYYPLVVLLIVSNEDRPMKAIIAMPALCLALALDAVASCPVEHPRVQPVIPDVAVASRQEMQQALQAAEQYLLQGKIYLDCGYMNRRQYNQLRAELELFEERYNTGLVEYRTHNRMLAEVDEVRAVPVAANSAR